MDNKMPKPNGNDEYNIIEHVHRFAAWAASRAAMAARIQGFTVQQGNAIIKAAELPSLLGGPDKLPKIEDMDAKHKEWRIKVKREAKRKGLDFSHGVAAKLINVYLKAGLVTVANCNNARIGALHPPIDSVLLEKLESCETDPDREESWTETPWSKLSSKKYEALICRIRGKLGNDQPLWAIEKYWVGHRAP
jgi:hypothetical protein